jgi:serine/threonine protein kinase
MSPDDKEFEKEVTILKKLGSKRKPHPHLIKLLATYRQKQKYHLMFPYADANLRKYWDDRPTPTFDETTVLWSMRQMTGLANALMTIHTFRVTVPLSVAGAGAKRIQKDAELSVRKGEEWYGRHGDIKPENILWFKESTESERGILQIADFGLGRFHGRDSRSQVDPETVLTSPTYEPPECKLRRPVSRAYDLWSLGCVYLEFVTWLLKGSKEIENFADFRGRQSTSTGINDDNFFTITRDPATGDDAVVREQVGVWADQLHHHTKCSGLIHDLIDLTMDQLLVVDSNNRVNASCLYWDMKHLLDRAETDREYMLQAVPPPAKQRSWGRSNSTSNVLGEPGKTETTLRSNNSLPGREKPIPPLRRPLDELRKLVSCSAPALKRTKKKSVTWPPGPPLGRVEERIEDG